MGWMKDMKYNIREGANNSANALLDELQSKIESAIAFIDEAKNKSRDREVRNSLLEASETLENLLH